MRTVRFEVSTEVMVGDDDEAEEAGEDAMRFLNAFCTGTTKANS